MPDTTTKDRILDAAEARARSGGYNAFSFRELADDVGVKSSSIHYHFPTKPALAEALTQRYVERARGSLGDAATLSADEALARVTGLFRNALVRDDRMCLCGLFGAERDVLPPAVDAAVASFFRLILDYLRTAFASDAHRDTPEAVLARLEGALIVARSLRDTAVFEAAVAER
jgi:TetR/AcrR family transcriptional repressor of nem operon